MEQQQLQKLVEQLSVEKFQKPFLHKAYFNLRLKSTGGRYLLNTHDLEFNYKLYEHFGEEELVGIILHELCHYHLHIEGKGYQHRDRDFRELLKEVGGLRFCSSLPNATKKQIKKLHVYQCKACYIEYRRKRRIDVRKYRCGKCSGALIYKETLNHQ